MLLSVAIGLLAAGVVTAANLLSAYSTARVQWLAGVPSLFTGGTTLLVVVLAAWFSRLARKAGERKLGSGTYCGLADLLIHIHAPTDPDSSIRWLVRGLFSFVLSGVLPGAPGLFGIEGAVTEAGQALAMFNRPRQARWFEQRRRTDAACVLAAGIGAAFGAPFTGVLLPLELGFGGRTISTAMAAVTAFLGVRGLSALLALPFPGLPGGWEGAGKLNFELLSWQQWLGVVLIGLFGGGIATLAVRFSAFCRRSLLRQPVKSSWPILAGGVLLALVVFFSRIPNQPVWAVFEPLLEGAKGPLDIETVVFLFCSRLMVLVLALAVFGSIGILWPLFALGGLLGFFVSHLLLPVFPGFPLLATLAGGVAFWAAALGAPFSGAVLAYEMTGSVQILFPCLLAGAIASWSRKAWKGDSWLTSDLKARGMVLRDGRSVAILRQILVIDAMVTDYETVHEQEPVADLRARLLKSRYPFLPVVREGGFYLGLLTIDMVQEIWHAQEKVHTYSSLAKLLEVKDLLYRAGFKTPVLKVKDELTASAGLFSEYPCVPVVNESGAIQGLLFGHNVRLAYEREVARRSLELE